MSTMFTPSSSSKTVNFEDVQHYISTMNRDGRCLLINTLSEDKQSCLIQNTVLATEEERIINAYVAADTLDNNVIIIYGENYSDERVVSKYNQLCFHYGFTRVYMYKGGLFEWLLLGEIYGLENFPTSTPPPLDILKFKPLSNNYIKQT